MRKRFTCYLVIGQGQPSSKQVYTMIAADLGYTDEIVWDRTKPNGQPRRCVDVSRDQQMFGFRAAHSLREGIAKTIVWFMDHREVALQR
jgi:GDP-L-fucose synthase